METNSNFKLSLTRECLAQVCASGGGLDAFVRSENGPLEGLYSYLDLLMKWNKVMNLVGPTHWQDVLCSLVADSGYLVRFLEQCPVTETPECWDLGAGAGLPGVPLRMLWSKGTYTLVEAREKRALFLKTVLATTALANTDVFRGRVEQFMPTRPQANIILSRAFMPWEKMLAFVEKYLAPEGFCVFLALHSAPTGMVQAGNALWTAIAEEQYTVGNDIRYFWAMRKTGKD